MKMLLNFTLAKSSVTEPRRWVSGGNLTTTPPSVQQLTEQRL